MRVFLRVYTNVDAYFTDVYIIIRVRTCVCVYVCGCVCVCEYPRVDVHFIEVYFMMHGGGGGICRGPFLLGALLLNTGGWWFW